MSKRDTFLKLLREDILKLDLADLDFGIYRVLNYRRDEIERFISERLTTVMGRALSGQSGNRLAEVQSRLDGLRDKLDQAAKMMGYEQGAFVGDELRDQLQTMPFGEQYTSLSEELRYLSAQQGFAESEEDRLYNALYVFFARYYRDGDFMTQTRRARDASYTVPYSGEDVHFHWKSRGSHYVKTTEELRSYTYRSGAWRVLFELRGADEAQDNNKGATRYFVPQPKTARADASSYTFTLPFVFRPLTKAEETAYNGKKKEQGENGNGDKTLSIQDRVLTDALAALRPKLPGDLDADALRHNMRRYARKNRTDYFVHADLKTFLTAEWEFYLKHEFLDINALTSPEQLTDSFLKLRVLREVGGEIITLLDQIEGFQARLFEKRKFVLRADYLVPVRLVPQELWPELVANSAQLDAWRTLFGLQDPIDDTTLRTRPTLVVDTRHFDARFKQRLLAAFEDIDGSTDGLLIHGENYAALQTIGPAYAGQVKVIYIDPPYNTGSDGFLYKDDFSRHSTWLSMMEERLRLARDLLADDGAIFVSIDDNEQVHLKQLMDRVFGEENSVATVIWQKVFAPKNTARYFSDDHEYVVVYAKKKARWRPSLLERSEAATARYSNPDNDPRGDWASGDLTARNYYGEGTYEVVSPGGATFRPAIGTYWRVSKTNFERLDQEKRIYWGSDGNNMPRLKRFLSEVKQGVVPQTLWFYRDVGHTQDAKQELVSIVRFERSEDVLNTVKPLDLIRRVLQIGTDEDEPAWVIDFFAGSGTTAHATIVQNAADGGRRKFIITEMGEYFEQLTFQRVIRAMYSPEWRDGRPKDDPLINPLLLTNGVNDGLPEWIERAPRLVKLLRLESYEDSLNALELPEERSARMRGQMRLWGDEYFVNYLLDAETADSPVLLNMEQLEQPFDYRLRIHTPEGTRDLPVDLVETFNLLMGLQVRRTHELHDDERRYVVVEALEGGRDVLVVWRDVARLDPARERAFLLNQFAGIAAGRYATVYTNTDSALPNGQSLDMRFKQRMLNPQTGREGLE